MKCHHIGMQLRLYVSYFQRRHHRCGLIAQSKFAVMYSWELFANCVLVHVVLTLAVFVIYKMWKPQVETLSSSRKSPPYLNVISS